MPPSPSPAAGDSRPPAALDRLHPATGDCSLCHNTTSFLDPTTPRPSNHVPTAALCSQCHTTAGNWALYSVTGTHQGVTGCLSCHGPGTGPFAGPPPGNTITIVGWPGGNHIPIGSADCNGSGCHSTANVNAGGFLIGTANISAPTLNVAGHTTVASVGACSTCHQSAPYLGMMASTSTAAGDSRPNSTLDSKHPTTGDCGSCHATAPTLATDLLPTAPKLAGHTTVASGGACPTCPQSAPYLGMMASTSTAAGDSRPNATLDSKHPTTGDCGNCHVTTPTFATDLLPTAGKPSNHIPTTAACAQCHTTAGNFALYSVTAPHQGVTGCLTCHGPTVAQTFANVTI